MTKPSAWIGFIAMSIGMFMAILDIQIVASSLPDIQAGLLIPRHLLSWIQTGYLIAEIIAMMLSGFLTPVLSTGGLFAASVFGFTLFSVGCAWSQNWETLIAFRVLQGFCGGAIIPVTFSAGYTIFPPAQQDRAVLIAGSLAVLAPTIGPCLGGYITENFDWPWLFLINLGPGLIVVPVVWFLIRVDRPDPSRLRRIDVGALVSLSLALAAIELLLNQAPQDHWRSGWDKAYGIVALSAGWFGLRRCRVAAVPLIQLDLFRDRGFAAACALNFLFGAGLYGSVYLLPLFLGFVRDHTALEIGIIMTAMGGAQLLAAPVAAIADRRCPPALVATIGFVLFACGMLANGFETPRSDAAALFWPQVLRGCGVLLIILPLTTAALASQPRSNLADASALLNVLRNIGGAIGIAGVDTIIISRSHDIGDEIVARLRSGDRDTAAFVGLPLDRFHGGQIGPISDADREFVRPLVEHAAATIAFNEAWLILGSATVAGLMLIPFLRKGNRVTKAPDLI